VNNTKSFSQNGGHIDGIESFWELTKQRLEKVKGLKKK
jgi:hypothetical protein